MKRNIALLAALLLGAVPLLAASALWSTPLATELPEEQSPAMETAAPSCTGDAGQTSPGPGSIDPPCYVSYCKSAGVRCVFNRRTGCGCKYVSQVDLTCTEGEAPPPDFCVCT